MTTIRWRSGGLLVGPIVGWALAVSLAASGPGWAAGADVEKGAGAREGRAAQAGATAPDDGLTPSTPRPTPTPTPGAEAKTPAAGPGARAAEAKAAPSKGATNLVYVPPSRGQARHTAGAGTRGISPTAGRPGEVRPRVAIVAPRDHVGLTKSAAPTLYWHLSAPTTTRIELTVVDDEAIEPVVQVALPGPVAPGLHALELSKLGVELAPAKTYRWFVALVHDAHRRSKDELAEGAIERVAPEASPSAPSSPSSPPASASALRSAALRAARDGYWYDAFAELSTAIERDPADAGLVADRRALLEQGRVGLDLR